MVTIERSRLVHSPRDHRLPQAASVISVWNGASKSVVAASAPSTYSSLSTSRRVRSPSRKRGDLTSVTDMGNRLRSGEGDERMHDVDQPLRLLDGWNEAAVGDRLGP